MSCLINWIVYFNAIAHAGLVVIVAMSGCCVNAACSCLKIYILSKYYQDFLIIEGMQCL